MGAEENDPHPRPCIKPGQPGTPFEANPGCTEDFDHANLSRISADQTYLARVKPSPETINDIKAYFMNFPSKFISPDGKSLWLCCSANFSPGWNGAELKFKPPADNSVRGKLN